MMITRPQTIDTWRLIRWRFFRSRRRGDNTSPYCCSVLFTCSSTAYAADVRAVPRRTLGTVTRPAPVVTGITLTQTHFPRSRHLPGTPVPRTHNPSTSTPPSLYPSPSSAFLSLLLDLVYQGVSCAMKKSSSLRVPVIRRHLSLAVWSRAVKARATLRLSAILVDMRLGRRW